MVLNVNDLSDRTCYRRLTGFVHHCLCLDLLDLAADDTSALLLEQHDVETVKVSHLTLVLACGLLLGPGGLGPLLCHVLLVEELLDDGRSGATGQSLECETGKGQVSVTKSLTGNTGGGAVDDSLVVVNDVCDDGQLALLLAFVQDDHTADLDVTLEARHDCYERRIREEGFVSMA